LGRKIYIGLVVVLASCCERRITSWFSRVCEAIGISLRTLYRWRSFWQRVLPSTRFWQEVRGRLMPIPQPCQLPWSLLQFFTGTRDDQSITLLKFLSPITIGPMVTIREGH
jgi:hypothetical protein